MKYRAFGKFTKGYAHVRLGTGVEDYAGFYNDPEERFYIGVICDGHSDVNCFRSAKGAQFGCDCAVETLKRFFELYFGQDPSGRKIPPGTESRLKRSLLQGWNDRVAADILENPVTADEMEPLTERVRKIYQSGAALQNIYGATFLCVAFCEDFFLSMHIGDGVVLCIDRDGSYYCPLPVDEKSETGSPASLCDTDLLTRENAFRMAFSNRIPQIAAVSSDGIGDCMDSFGYKLFMREVFSKLYSLEEKVQFPDEMNEKQVKYIDSFLAYYAGQGHGAEDDCSLAFIYDPEADAPAVRLSIQEARDSWNSTARERNSVILDYERRKKAAFEELKKIMSDQDYRADSIRNKRWIELKERAEDLKRILRNMISNEKEKVTAYNRKLDFYMKQITANDEDITSMTDLKHILNLDESILIEDADYSSLKQLRKCWIEAKKAYEAAEKSAEPFSPEVLEQMKKECRSKETDYLRSVESYICMIQEKESAVQKPSGLLGSLKLRRK